MRYSFTISKLNDHCFVPILIKFIHLINIMAANSDKNVNPILPQFIDKMDPQFVEIYTKYQGTASEHIYRLQLNLTNDSP